ncbi:MAG: tRNA pseudouridine(38-40) synthase TruA [Lachnospiraceae bacterium]|nr:tRNA pseudouridine(38-40) synthase TruA [Lachnospiraceae bacterium]
MRRILLTIAYDGTDFHGFAFQEGVRTVEGEIAHAVKAITGETPEIIGASRTDTGVHAYGNLATFDTETSIEAERFPYALNSALPEDVRIVHAEEVPVQFHPRGTGWKKTYEYRILNTPWPDPVRRRTTCHMRAPLDVEAMDAAARHLRGTHDFTSFCSAQALSPTRERTIYEIGVTKEEDLVTIRVTGSGFLYHMVRIIAGTLIDVGRGRDTPEDVRMILEAKDRAAAGKTAEPQGLFLMGYTRD